MKDIKTLLTETGIEIPSEKVEQFTKEFGENYKTVADYQKQVEKETNLNAQLTELNKQIQEIDLDEVEGLKNKIKEYETKESERVEAEEKAVKDKQLTELVVSAIGDREFVNEYTKNSIVNEVKTALADNVGKGAKELFEELTKDKEGIFTNPQSKVSIPAGNGGKPSTSDSEYLESKYRDNPFFRK